MSKYDDKIKSLSDDMLGQLYLAARKELFNRDIDPKLISRRQVKIHDVIGFYSSKTHEKLYGYVTRITKKTILATQIDSPEDAGIVNTGVRWKIGSEVFIIDNFKPTGLPKKETPVPSHIIQTKTDEIW